MTAEVKKLGNFHPNIIAALDTIAWSEGTDDGKQTTNDRGYDVLVGGGLFTGYADHPRKSVFLPKIKTWSTGAGRYQILERFWDAYKIQLKLPDFGPLSQDMIAIQLMRETKAVPMLERGDIEGALAAMRSRWASLPGAGYGQHEHQLANLLAAYTRAGGSFA